MNRIPLLLIFLVVCFSYESHGQFRKRKTQKTGSFNARNLNYANPAEYTIGGIDIQGLNVLDENALKSLIGLKVGDNIKIPGDPISGAIRKLWKYGLVGNIVIAIDSVKDNAVFLSIRVTERPRLTNFYFTGIPSGVQTTLKEELSLIRGKIVNDAMIKNAELTIKKFFYNKGFLNAEVNIVQEKDTLNRGGIRLRIDVDRHPRVRINKIVFLGNENMSPFRMKGKLKKTKEYARFLLPRRLLGEFFALFKKKKPESLPPPDTLTGWKKTKQFITENVKLNIFASSKYIPSVFEEDKKRLVDYYNTKGYRDAAILYNTIKKSSKNTISLYVRIEEGKRYYFRNITWVGNYVHTDAALNSILDIKKGDVYNKQLIDLKTTYDPKGLDISSLYMDDGYLFFRILPTEIAVEDDSIDLEMRIFEGEQATIRNVTIEGNTRTNDHVILRELRTIPGEKFRRSDIIRTQQQLSQMGFFDPQKIEPNVMPNPSEGTVDIGWKLEEQSNDQVQLSGGWGGPFGFVGTVGITFNNFSIKNIPHFDKWRPLPIGDGQRLSLSVQANGAAYQNYNFSFTEPWLGGRKPNSFTVNFNYSISRQAVGNTFVVDNSASLRQIGLTVVLGRRLEWPDNYFTLQNSISFLQYNYRDNYFRSSIIPENGQTINLRLETVFSRNSIDHPIYPTRGSNLSLSLALTPPYSLFIPDYLDDPRRQFKWVEMHKWMFDAKLFLKLVGGSKPNGRSLVLAPKIHFGFIGVYNKALQPGPFERFLLGGAGLAGGFNSFVLGQDVIGLRGYEDNSITPPLYALRGNVNSDKIQGGITYTKMGMELRYPVTLGQTATIYTFLFAEAGNNWDNFQEFNPFNLYRSAGVGLGIFMPAFGLIGLNWAYGFDTLPGSPDQSGSRFHFTIGQQIR